MFKIISSLFFGIALFFGLVGCQSNDKSPPSIVVSIPPYVSLIQKITEGTVQVTSAISPSFNPHIAEITPRQMQLMQNASLWIGVGEAYEASLLQTLKEKNRNLTIIQMNQLIPLLSFSEDTQRASNESQDLHFWLSPIRLKAQVKIMADALIKLLPHMKNRYLANLKNLLEELDQLDRDMRSTLIPYKGNAILVSHDAFGYYCHDYHLVQIAIEHHGKSPLPHQLSHVIENAKHYSVRCVFTQPQFDNKGAIFIADHLKLRHYSVDPLKENVLENLKEITQKIAL